MEDPSLVVPETIAPLDEETLRQQRRSRILAMEAEGLQRRDRIEKIEQIEPEVDRSFFGDQAPEEGDGFFDNTKEIVLTAGETAAEGIVRFVGNAGDDFSSDETPYLVAGTHESLDDVGINVFGLNIGFVKKKEFDLRRTLYEIETGEQAVTAATFDIPDADRPDSDAGKMTSDMMRWLMIFAATRQAAGGGAASVGGEIALGAGAGFVADLTSFDPHEDRLSKMVKEWGEGNPALDNALTQYLSEDADSATENSLKHAIEGLALGAATEGVMLGLRWLRSYRSAKKFRDTPVTDTPLDTIKADAARESTQFADGVASVMPGDDINTRFLKDKVAADKATGKVTTAADTATGKVTAKEGAKEIVDDAAAEVVAEVGQVGMKDAAKAAFKFRSEVDKESFMEAFNNGDFAKLGEMTEFNEKTIDWDAMDNPDQLRDFMRGLEQAAADFLGEAGQKKVSFAATKQMAMDNGFSEANAHQLFGATQAENGLAARMLAAQQAQVANAKRLFVLGETAKSGKQEDVALFHQALEQQAALMGVVKGSSREIARALANMRQLKDAAADSFEAFGEVIKRHGGVEGTRELAETLMKQNSLRDLHRVVEKTTKAGFMDWVTEVSINGMLSSLKTHVVNFTSNVAMGFVITPIERLMAGAIGLRHNKYALSREARSVVATYTAIPAAAKLMLRALATGAPVADIRQKIEVSQRMAIRADPTKWNGWLKPVAHFLNATGTVIRLPGRALIGSDEFFKGVTRIGELTGVAWESASRAADAKGLRGSERTGFIKDEMKKLIEKPTRAMEDDAVAAARRATFQEDAQTGIGGAFSNALNANPIIKLIIAPFVKTPMNLLRQAFIDRNPIFAPIAKQNWKAIKQGGKAADEVYARMAIGTGILAMGWGMAEGGFITGKGESYQNTEKLDKVPEYSIRLGDTWIPYNRFDPVGSMLGLMADLHYGYARGYDPGNPEGFTEWEHTALTTFTAITNNALSKTWAKSMNDVIEAGEMYLEGSVGSSRRAIQKLAGENLFKLVPFGSAIRNYAGYADPVIREAWTINERMLKNLPGYSEGLPQKHDLLGRPITRQNHEAFMYNPFAPVPESKDPVDLALANLEFEATMIDKSIDGVPLSATQYQRFKKLIGDFEIGGAPTLYEQIHELIKAPAWDQMTDGMKVDVVKDIISSRKTTAKALLVQEDGFSLLKRTMQVDRYNLEQYTEQDMSEYKEAIEAITGQ